MATAQEYITDAQPSETHEAELAVSIACDESDSTDEFLQPPIEGAAAQLAERFHRHHDKRGLRVISEYDLLARSS